jgi:hypothetical protein
MLCYRDATSDLANKTNERVELDIWVTNQSYLRERLPSKRAAKIIINDTMLNFAITQRHGWTGKDRQ